MKAYSQDLRERVLWAVDEGRERRRDCTTLWHLRSATLKRYVKQWREEGHVRPKAIPGRPPRETSTSGSERTAPITGARLPPR
jgi:transposase